MNIFIERVKPYNSTGRLQNKDESDELANRMKLFLGKHGITPKYFDGCVQAYDRVIFFTKEVVCLIHIRMLPPIADIQSMLHIGRNTAYSLLKNNAISSIHVGKKYIIPKSSVIDFLSSRKGCGIINPSDEVAVSRERSIL